MIQQRAEIGVATDVSFPCDGDVWCGYALPLNITPVVAPAAATRAFTLNGSSDEETQVYESLFIGDFQIRDDLEYVYSSDIDWITASPAPVEESLMVGTSEPPMSMPILAEVPPFPFAACPEGLQAEDHLPLIAAAGSVLVEGNPVLHEEGDPAQQFAISVEEEVVPLAAAADNAITNDNLNKDDLILNVNSTRPFPSPQILRGEIVKHVKTSAYGAELMKVPASPADQPLPGEAIRHDGNVTQCIHNLGCSTEGLITHPSVYDEFDPMFIQHLHCIAQAVTQLREHLIQHELIEKDFQLQALVKVRLALAKLLQRVDAAPLRPAEVQALLNEILSKLASKNPSNEHVQPVRSLSSDPSNFAPKDKVFQHHSFSGTFLSSSHHMNKYDTRLNFNHQDFTSAVPCIARRKSSSHHKKKYESTLN